MAEITVIGPDGTRFTFPEGTDRETMLNAMRRRYTGENRRAREMIMTSQLPDPALQGVRDYLERDQLRQDIDERRAQARAQEAAGPENIAKERFYTGAQGYTLGAAPVLQGAINVPIAAAIYPFLTEEERAGRDLGQFVSEMSSLGYDQARGNIDRARESRPLESAGLELAGGFLTGKTVYDELGKRFLAQRAGARGAAVGAGAGAQYGFLEGEGDIGQGIEGALIGAPAGAGLAKTFEAAAGPLGRMFGGERPLVLGPRDEVLTLADEVPADYFSSRVSAQERAMLLGQDIPEAAPVRQRPTGPEPAPMAPEDIPPAPDMSQQRLSAEEIAVLLSDDADDIVGMGWAGGARPRGFKDDLPRGTERFWDDALPESQNKAIEMARNGYSNAEIAEEVGWANAETASAILRTLRNQGYDIPKAQMGREPEARVDILRLAEKGLRPAQIAKRLGKSANQVQVTLSKARKALAQTGQELPEWLQPRTNLRGDRLSGLAGPVGGGVIGSAGGSAQGMVTDFNNDGVIDDEDIRIGALIGGLGGAGLGNINNMRDLGRLFQRQRAPARPTPDPDRDRLLQSLQDPRMFEGDPVANARMLDNWQPPAEQAARPMGLGGGAPKTPQKGGSKEWMSAVESSDPHYQADVFVSELQKHGITVSADKSTNRFGQKSAYIDIPFTGHRVRISDHFANPDYRVSEINLVPEADTIDNVVRVLSAMKKIREFRSTDAYKNMIKEHKRAEPRFRQEDFDPTELWARTLPPDKLNQWRGLTRDSGPAARDARQVFKETEGYNFRKYNEQAQRNREDFRLRHSEWENAAPGNVSFSLSRGIVEVPPVLRGVLGSDLKEMGFGDDMMNTALLGGLTASALAAREQMMQGNPAPAVPEQPQGPMFPASAPQSAAARLMAPEPPPLSMDQADNPLFFGVEDFDDLPPNDPIRDPWFRRAMIQRAMREQAFQASQR